MGINIPLLNSCCCCSLRTGVIIVGSLQLFLYALYFVETLVYRIHVSEIENKNKIYYVLMSDILFEYVETIQLIFSCILIYGAVKEKSSFITAWLLTELTKVIDCTCDVVLVWMRFFPWSFVIEELILLGSSVISVWIVYSYYNTMPKSKYIL